MMPNRRAIISSIACSLPFGFWSRAHASTAPVGSAPTLRLRSFEEGVRQAFADRFAAPETADDTGRPWRRIEIGCSEQVRVGVQGCHNEKPFAGFPAGHLRIIRTGSEPGPIQNGVRLYVSTVDVVHTGGLAAGAPSHALDFASLPPAPIFS